MDAVTQVGLLPTTDNDKHSGDMKEQRLDILQKVANGELTPEQAD